MTSTVVTVPRPDLRDIRLERPLSADALALKKRADAIRLLRYERQCGLPHFASGRSV